MKIINAVLLTLALLFLASCSVNEELAKAYIMTVDTVGEEWHEYAQADENLTDEEKERRVRKHQSMNILRDDLAEEIDYQEEK